MLIYLTMIEAEEDRHRFLSLYRRYKKLMLYIPTTSCTTPTTRRTRCTRLFCALRK